MPLSYSEAHAAWERTAPTFTFKHVEAILAIVFGIVPAKRKAFAARLQQLQKLGLPPGSNAGRGQRVAYRTWQLCDLQFYLDLIDAGVTPALIAARYACVGFFAVDGAGRFGENAARRGTSYCVLVRMRALEHLAIDTPTLTESNATFSKHSLGSDVTQIVEGAEGEPGVLIDIGARLRALKAAIAKVAPDAADSDLFMHLAGES